MVDQAEHALDAMCSFLSRHFLEVVVDGAAQPDDGTVDLDPDFRLFNTRVPFQLGWNLLLNLAIALHRRALPLTPNLNHQSWTSNARRDDLSGIDDGHVLAGLGLLDVISCHEQRDAFADATPARSARYAAASEDPVRWSAHRVRARSGDATDRARAHHDQVGPGRFGRSDNGRARQPANGSAVAASFDPSRGISAVLELMARPTHIVSLRELLATMPNVNVALRPYSRWIDLRMRSQIANGASTVMSGEDATAVLSSRGGPPRVRQIHLHARCE